ncbi:MAG: hypothetical protein ACU0DW_05610 [Shimia sp.]
MIVPDFRFPPEGPFDFLNSSDRYGTDPKAVFRLNRRFEAIVAPFAKDIVNAKVVDLASHDGRWPFALVHAGAKEVIGLEGRQELIDQFDTYPDSAMKKRVEMRCCDIFDGLRTLKTEGYQPDVVAVFGIFYHITEQYLLLNLIKQLDPKLIIIDSEFARKANGPILRFAREKVDNHLNTIDRGSGTGEELVAVPSFKLMDTMAEVMGYEVEWVDWTKLPPAKREGVHDYFRSGDALRKRATVALRKKG